MSNQLRWKVNSAAVEGLRRGLVKLLLEERSCGKQEINIFCKVPVLLR